MPTEPIRSSSVGPVMQRTPAAPPVTPLVQAATLLLSGLSAAVFTAIDADHSPLWSAVCLAVLLVVMTVSSILVRKRPGFSPSIVAPSLVLLGLSAGPGN